MREEWGEEKVYAKNKYPHGKAGNALLYSQFVKGESINKMTEGGGGRKEDNKTNCLFLEEIWTGANQYRNLKIPNINKQE